MDSQMEMDAKQFERDVTLGIYRLHKELRDHNAGRKNSQPETVADDFNGLLAVTQKMLQSFQCWKETMCSLCTRQSAVGPRRVDHTNCNGTTSNGHLETTDAHVSNLLPAPCSSDTINVLKRLEWHLLVCWFTCEKKFEATLRDSINSLLSHLEKHSNGTNLLNGKTQIIQVIDSVLNEKENVSTINWSSIHQLFNNLRNDLTTQNNPALMQLIEIVAATDRAIVSYQCFHDQWSQYKQTLEAKYRQKIEFIRDLKLFGKLGNSSRHRCQRFYELKLTAVQTVMREETTYTKPHQPSPPAAVATVAAGTTSLTSVNSGERYQSVAAEQLTSMSHEESTKFVVKSVIDPRDGSEISIEQAVKDGIIDHQSGRYMDLATGQSWPIATAMNEGRIHVEKVLTTRTEPKTKSLGLITIRTQTDTREYVIIGARDTTTGKLLSADEARQQGIVDETDGIFLDTSTGQKLPISDAVDAGFVAAQFDEEQTSAPCETKTYAVSAVVDQMLRRPVPFPEAVRCGLIDRLTGSYVNNVTGEKVFAAEAIRRGLFKCTVIDGTSTLNVADIDSSHQVVVNRIDRVRKNVLRSINVLSALKQQAECA